MSDAAHVRRFGAFELNLRSRELRKNGRPVRLPDQPLQVLAALAGRPGELVTREELRARVWPANTFVDFDNSLNIAIAKLRQIFGDSAAKPRFIETVPRRGYRFVAQLDETAAAPAALPDAAVIPPTPPGRNWRAKALAATAAAFALLLGAGGWLQFVRPSSAAPSARPSLAAMGFKDIAGKGALGWKADDVADLLATDLGADGRLRVASGEDVARARADLNLRDEDCYATDTLRKLRRNLRSDYIVTGAFSSGPDAASAIRLSLCVQDARSAETVARSSIAAKSVAEIALDAGSFIRGRLRLAQLTQEDDGRVRAAISANPDAEKLYREGLRLLWRYDSQAARAALEQAVRADPEYALAHAALAKAWDQAGYADNARHEAKLAWDLAANLPLATRSRIEAEYRESTADWDRAIAIYRQLAARFPAEADCKLALANVELQAGRANDAHATLQTLHALPPPERDNPAIDLMQSRVAEELGDLEGARAAAARAAESAQSREAFNLAAAAYSRECRELQQIRRLDDARAACESARLIFARTGDRRGEAEVLGYLGAARYDEGDLGAAEDLYSQALDINRQIGNERGSLWELDGLADVLWARGDLGGARLKYQAALDVAQRIGSPSEAASAMDNIAVTWMLEGDLPQALRLSEQALDIFRRIGDASDEGSVLDNLGQTLYYQGDLAAAAQRLEEALARSRQAGAKFEVASALAWSGRVRLAQGNADEAGQRYRESLRAWSEAGSAAYAAKCRLRLAELALETGNPKEAEANIRDGLPLFQREKQRDVEIQAHALLARAFAAEGQMADAAREIDDAARLVKASRNEAVRLEFSIAQAQVWAATGKGARIAQASRALNAVIAEAGRRGFLGYQLAARLALADVELRSGRAGAARADLEELEKDARARGFGWIAGKAAAALRTSKAQRGANLASPYEPELRRPTAARGAPFCASSLKAQRGANLAAPYEPELRRPTAARGAPFCASSLKAQRGAGLVPPYEPELRRPTAARGAPFCASFLEG